MAAAVVVAAATRSSTRIESLERRILLAHVGLDLGFGDAGYAPVDASLLVAPLPGGKVLAVGELGAVRLNPDGTLDEVFVDRGTKSDVERDADVAAVAGQQLFIAGQMHPGLSEEGWPIQQIFVRKVNLRTGGTGAGFGTDGLVLSAPVAAVADARRDSLRPHIDDPNERRRRDHRRHRKLPGGLPEPADPAGDRRAKARRDGKT